MAEIEVMTLLNSLAAFGGTVPGVQSSFRLADTPNVLTAAQLPALVLFPKGGSGDDFHFQTFMGNSPHLKISLVQQLFFAPSDSTDYRTALPGMLSLLSAYMRQAKLTPFLDTRDTSDGSKAWQVPLNFAPQIGPAKYADISYHSIAFYYAFDIQL